jgi:hypothetical protein
MNRNIKKCEKNVKKNEKKFMKKKQRASLALLLFPSLSFLPAFVASFFFFFER